ncbi:hypothetical protein [Cereibacter sphaeroides]|jgi:hypothetical protein|uniref:hypothetical protein n=1 Tax=Cereibacter sphaeroides TaxID=1063 RepID=UPI00006640DC|nr:hypothetical protein Rsph17029_0651 [Cereibacter sphaeroides ATCC 17029]
MRTFAVSRPTTRKRRVRAFNGETARHALKEAGFDKGRECFGFNKGQFSFIDLLEAALHYTGPGKVTCATWTAADADLRRIAAQMENRLIEQIRWIVDYSFETRQPEFCATMRRLFGDECIRTTASHAKFALVETGEWRLVIQTSMNLNQNKRVENFWIGDDPDLFEAYSELVADIFGIQGPGEGFGQKPGVRKRELQALAREPGPFDGIGSIGTFGSDLNTFDDF